MKRLEQLPEVANRQLGGLTATSTRWQRQSAAEMRQPRRRASVGACAGRMRRVGLCLGPEASSLASSPRPLNAGQALGGRFTSSIAPRTAGDVPVGSLRAMSAGQRQFQSDPCSRRARGRAFRSSPWTAPPTACCKAPTGISSSLLGEELGQVTEFNVEPALGTSGAKATWWPAWETVYHFGMSGALVAAQVDGSTRNSSS